MIVVVALTSASGAEPSTDHAKAVELFEDGRRFMTNHDPAAACAKFAESIRIEPLAAGTMLNLGLCHQQLGHYKTALYWFRKAQLRATETDPPLPAYEQEAREHTTHLAAIVPTIRIDLAGSSPQDAQVSIDDELVRPEDYAHVELDPGHHVVVATATGKATFRRELEVAGRGGQTVVVELLDVAATPAPEPQPPAPDHSGGQRRRIAIYLASAGGAFVVGSLGLTLYEKHVYNQNKAAAMQGDAGALDSTRNATSIARDYGTGLALVGLAAAGVAAYLYVTAPDEETVVAPVLAPGHAGVVMTRRF